MSSDPKYNRRDNDGHKFNIPDDMLELFDYELDLYNNLSRFSDEYYIVESRFNYLFERYMVS